MGWSIGYDPTWKRDIGYGVPAFCDHPECSAEIDRGLSFVCGGEPYGGDHGCGLFFCEEHHLGYREATEEDGGDDVDGLCSRCEAGKPPFEPKPEHPRWAHHKLTDSSWAQWRAENPAEVAQLRALVSPGS